MMQSFVLMAVVSVVWAIVGYSLSFDTDNAFFGGLDFAFRKRIGAAPAECAPTIPHTTWMVYQLMFGIITPTLICGAYTERMRFSAMLLFSVLGLLLGIYCPMAHMVWCKGGLFNFSLPGSPSVPAPDFAGGTVAAINAAIRTDSTSYQGLLYGNAPQFGRQLLTVVITWVIAIVGSFVMLKIVDVLVGLRVTADDDEGARRNMTHPMVSGQSSVVSGQLLTHQPTSDHCQQ